MRSVYTWHNNSLLRNSNFACVNIYPQQHLFLYIMAPPDLMWPSCVLHVSAPFKGWHESTHSLYVLMVVVFLTPSIDTTGHGAGSFPTQSIPHPVQAQQGLLHYNATESFYRYPVMKHTFHTILLSPYVYGSSLFTFDYASMRFIIHCVQ